MGVVAGLDTDPDMPGFKRILMRPQPGGGLTYAQVEYKSSTLKQQLNGP